MKNSKYISTSVLDSFKSLGFKCEENDLVTYQDITDWLRENKSIHIKTSHSTGEYICMIEFPDSYSCGEWKPDYYKALNSGLDVVINKLKSK